MKRLLFSVAVIFMVIVFAKNISAFTDEEVSNEISQSGRGLIHDKSCNNIDEDPEILWFKDFDAPCIGSAAVADVDDDGFLEIVFGTYYNDEKVYALNSEDGSVLWSMTTGGCHDAAPLITDIDLDGELEVIAPASQLGVVYCFNGTTGGIEWLKSTGFCIDSAPAAGDVDGDNRPEVVFGAFYGNVFCLNGEDGSVKWQRNLGVGDCIQADPGLVDIDGDGRLEIIVAKAYGDDGIYALDGIDGSTLWFSDRPDAWIQNGGSSADIDEDGKPEIAVGCYDDTVYLFNAEDGSVEWTYAGSTFCGTATSIADLTHDGHLEIVFGSFDRMGCLSNMGQLLWSYRTGGNIFRGAAIADVNGDDTLDVAFGSDDEIVRVLSGNNGSLIWEYDLGDHYGNVFEIDHAPVIEDFDNDGDLDLFIFGGLGRSSQPENNHGRAYVLSAGAGTGPGWRTFRHDSRHTANYHYAKPPVEVIILPFNDAPFVANPGGSFYYDGILINNTEYNITGDVWVMVKPEGGASYGPLNMFQGIQLSPLRTLRADNIAQTIPAWAPLGTYTYTAYAGLFPNLIIDSSSFDFYIDIPVAGSADDWSLSGWFEPPVELPSEFDLRCNYPNPFNSKTAITFSLPSPRNIELNVYNLRGQLVECLANGHYEAGEHKLNWNAEKYSSGIYFYKLSTGGKFISRRMLLIK